MRGFFGKTMIGAGLVAGLFFGSVQHGRVELPQAAVAKQAKPVSAACQQCFDTCDACFNPGKKADEYTDYCVLYETEQSVPPEFLKCYRAYEKCLVGCQSR